MTNFPEQYLRVFELYLMGPSEEVIAKLEGISRHRVAEIIADMTKFGPDAEKIEFHRRLAKYGWKTNRTLKDLVDAIHTKNWLDRYHVDEALIGFLKTIIPPVEEEAKAKTIGVEELLEEAIALVGNYLIRKKIDGKAPPISGLPAYVDELEQRMGNIIKQIRTALEEPSDKANTPEELFHKLNRRMAVIRAFNRDSDSLAKSMVTPQDTIDSRIRLQVLPMPKLDPKVVEQFMTADPAEVARLMGPWMRRCCDIVGPAKLGQMERSNYP